MRAHKFDVWHIPASRTKTNQQRRIPLCHEAQSIITTAQAAGATKHMFTSPTGKPLSDAAMSQLMIRKRLRYRPHGFRATFRTWVEEQTDMSFEVKEAALGHKVDKGVIA
ncbi:MAG: integrase, partial [Aestuariivita sp.]|nr:integrase [Aestuariivita sp.]